MGVELLSAEEAVSDALETLDLGANTPLTSPEALAASVRRTASFMAPVTPAALVAATIDVVRGLSTSHVTEREEVLNIVESLVSYGDLLELAADASGGRRQLYLGAPAFVRRRETNTSFLLGVRPEGTPLLSPELMPSIEYVGHVRHVEADEEMLEAMVEDGLIELQPEQWLKCPRPTSAEGLLTYYRDRLEAEGQSGDVEVRILDPSSDVGYYRGRWRNVKGHDAGDFVGRRAQAYGSDLWCLVRLSGGATARLIDLPQQSPLARASDEAWRLQAAIDASRGSPQLVQVREGDDPSKQVLAFFSPIPSWAQRRLDLIGIRRQGDAGALFAYQLSASEVAEELDFLKEMLWMQISESVRDRDAT